MTTDTASTSPSEPAPGSTIDPVELPATIRTFLAAHAAGEARTAVRLFTDDAVVVDQDESFSGTETVLDFLQNAGSEFKLHHRAHRRSTSRRPPLGGRQPHRGQLPGQRGRPRLPVHAHRRPHQRS